MPNDEVKMSPKNKSHRFSFSNIDCLVGFLAFLLGLAMALNSYKLGAGWSGDGLQPGYFPFRVGIAISIVGFLIFIKFLVRKKKDETCFSTSAGTARVSKILIPTVIYAAIIYPAGIYVSSVLFIWFFMVMIGKQNRFKSLLVSVGAALFLFVLFELVFKIPLPKGPLVNMLYSTGLI